MYPSILQYIDPATIRDKSYLQTECMKSVKTPDNFKVDSIRSSSKESRNQFSHLLARQTHLSASDYKLKSIMKPILHQQGKDNFFNGKISTKF